MTLDDQRQDRQAGAPFEGATEERGARATAEGVRRFAVGGAGRPPRVSISNPLGSIDVRAAEGEAEQAAVAVRALKQDGAEIPLDDVAEIHYKPQGEIEIRARPLNIERQVRRAREAFDFGRSSFLDNLGEIIESAVTGALGPAGFRINFEVVVPRRCDLDLATTRGHVEVRGVEGEVNARSVNGRVRGARVRGKFVAKTASGRIEIEDVDGAALLQTASGGIRTERVTGNLVMKTASGGARSHALNGQLGFKSASGGLNVRESMLSGFYVNTASGACSIDAAFGPGEYDARTVSGGIELRVQPDFSGILTGRTVSGGFRCAIPYRDADRDWRDELEDDDEDEGAEDLPEDEGAGGPSRGIRIDGEGVSLPGIRIGNEGVELPGIRIGGRPRDREREARRQEREARREAREGRRRKRNRWEFLLGDPAIAAARTTRLRVRTVSGSLSIRQGGEDQDMHNETGAWTAPDAPTPPPAPSAPAGAWPDSELWPAQAPAPPTPPTPPTPPVAGAMPVPPAPPSPPLGATEQPRPTGQMGQMGAQGAGPLARPLPPQDLPSGEPDEQVAPGTDSAEPTASADTIGTDDAPLKSAEQTRMEILQAVERKEITAGEALVLLRQLDG